FIKDKPNDQFPKAPPPDKEIIAARRAEADRAMRRAESEQEAAQAGDDTANRAKSAAKGEDQPGERGPRPTPNRPTPKMEEPGVRVAPAREDRPQTDSERPRRPLPPKPDPAVPDKDKGKRGKNG